MARDEQIYVGYRRMGSAQKRFTRFVVIAILVIGAGTGAMLAASIRPAGRGQWDMSNTVTETGVVRLPPYPYLETREGPILLAEPGKFGAQDRLTELAGRESRITGTALMRGNRRGIEIISVETIGEDASAAPSLEFVSDLIELRGEILDSKCFLGAMKHVAASEKKKLPDGAKIDAAVGIGPIPTGFAITAELTVHLPGMDRDEAQALVDRAHQVCPYSNATRGNVDVKLKIA